MVVIPAGHFEMGSSNQRAEERPSHEVVIPQDLAIGVYEVTVEEWNACSKDGACDQNPKHGLGGGFPIANISWDDAQSYVSWLSQKTGRKYRLPTEAEWEYAARAGTTTRYWWGDETGSEKASCADCGNPWDGKQAAPVGSFEPNPFGLFDVHGNLWEWTQDCWNPSYKGAPTDGGAWESGDCISRVLRGGAWALDHTYMRSTRRYHYDKDVRYYLHGLRVISELPAPTLDDASFESAVPDAVYKVFANAPGPATSAARRTLVLDPVVDGLSGAESVATRAMQSKLVELLGTRFSHFDIEELTASSAADVRYVVIGTFTGVNKERKTVGKREAFRICLALLDLESGTVTSKAKVFTRTEGVDITPTEFFRDSPAWTADARTQAYVKSCQATKPGDPVDPLYLDGIKAAALINQAIRSYEVGEYESARGLFKAAAETQGGEQLRTYNGLYLTSWRLGELDQAAEAFASIVDYGLKGGNIAVKLTFRPGSTTLLLDPNDGGQHELWLRQIAKTAAAHKGCFEIIGHTHGEGIELDARDLALRRAEYVKRRLEAEAPELRARITATGRGSEDNLIGSATADAEDALDRRIELKAMECPPTSAARQ